MSEQESTATIVEVSGYKSVLKLADLFDRHEDQFLTPAEFAKELAERLSLNQFAEDDDLKDIIEQLKVADNDIDSVDIIVDDLYEFADTDKRIFLAMYEAEELN
jgi:ATP-dependent helicase/DNAse subunit B